MNEDELESHYTTEHMLGDKSGREIAIETSESAHPEGPVLSRED